MIPTDILATEEVDKTFSELVSGIEELEGLQTPGWNFAWGFAVGSVFAGGVVAGLAVT